MVDNFNSIRFEEYKKQKLAIAEGNYYQAVLYYTQLKQMFMKSLNETVQQGQQKIKEEVFLQAISEGIQTNTNYNEQMDTIKQEVERQVQTAITNGGQLYSLVPTLLKELDDTVKRQRNKQSPKAIENYLNNASKTIDRVLQKQSLLDTIRNQAIDTLKEQQGKSIGNSITGAYAFYKRVLLDQLLNSSLGSAVNISDEWRKRILNDAALQGYANLIGGYFREALTTDAINDYLNNKKSYWSVYQTATVSPSNIYYDLIIGAKPSGTTSLEVFNSLEKTLDDMSKLTGNGQSVLTGTDLEHMVIPYYGIQTKSWSSPEALIDKGKSLRSQWFVIGDRQRILDSFPVLEQNNYAWSRGWHNSVKLVSQKIPEILGQYQVAYSLPSGLIWTSDLISQMHQNKLWLSFYYTRKKGTFNYPATAEVAWQPKLYLYSIRNKPKMTK